MKRISVVALLVVCATAVACARLPTQQSLDLSTGIRGSILLGPICPVQRSGDPCPDRPIEALVTVAGSGRTWSPVRTTPSGAFQIVLPPGTYQVEAKEIGGNARMAKPLSVSVRAGGFTNIQIVVDSGIR